MVRCGRQKVRKHIPTNERKLFTAAGAISAGRVKLLC